MSTPLSHHATFARWDDQRTRAADRRRAADVPARPAALPEDARLVIRLATPADHDALVRLAALDSRRLPAGDLLLVHAGGAPLAAIALHDGTAVADPFAPTAHVVDLLRVRAAALTAGVRTPRRRFARVRRLVPRAA